LSQLIDGVNSAGDIGMLKESMQCVFVFGYRSKINESWRAQFARTTFVTVEKESPKLVLGLPDVN